MDVTCAVCSKPFEAQNSRARYCSSTCRSRGNRAGLKQAQDAPKSDSGLVEATRRELEAAGRVDTALGQQALELAARLVSPLSTGAAVGALSKELRAVMAEATKGAGAASGLDELRRRREAKQRAG